MGHSVKAFPQMIQIFRNLNHLRKSFYTMHYIVMTIDLEPENSGMFYEPSNLASSVAFSPGNRKVFVTFGNKVQSFDIKSKQMIKNFDGHDNVVHSVKAFPQMIE